MTEEDKRIFDFDIRNFDWKQYVDAFCMGTKKYLFNEDLSKLPIARRQIKRWASVGCVDPRFMLIVASFPDQTGNEANRNDNFRSFARFSYCPLIRPREQSSAAQPSVQRSGELSPQCSKAFNSSVTDLTPPSLCLRELESIAPCSDTPTALCDM